MIEVMGADPALGSYGLAYRDAGELRLASHASKLRGWERIDELANFVRRSTSIARGLPDGPTLPLMVVTEAYSFGSKHRAETIAQAGGIIRFNCWFKAGVPFIEISPKTMKKFVTGSGNAEKEDVAAVLAAHGVHGRNDDETDAAGLWCLGNALLGQSHPLEEVCETSHLEKHQKVAVGFGL